MIEKNGHIGNSGSQTPARAGKHIKNPESQLEL
jgi:hypothetical protein